MTARKRGRPRKAASEQASVPLTVRLYESDAARLDALRAVRGESASQVVRAALKALYDQP